jgi:hypothetical protein
MSLGGNFFNFGAVHLVTIDQLDRGAADPGAPT